MDNILVESVRNSAELSFTQGGEVQVDEIITGKQPVLARSFEETVKDSFTANGTVDLGNTHMSMMLSKGPE